MTTAAKSATTLRYVVRREELAGPVHAAALLATLPAGEPIFYFEHPESGEAVLAVGAVATVETSGWRRFEEAAAATHSLLESLSIDTSATKLTDDAPLPRLVGGFAFADDLASPLWRDYAACRFVLPRTQWLLSRGRGVRFDVVAPEALAAAPRTSHAKQRALVARARSTATGMPGADASHDEPVEGWLARARDAVTAIERGRIEKIVLARSESLTLGHDVDVADLLGELSNARPSCYTFCVGAGESIFVGSSPEQLLRVNEGMVEADALAGTTARGTSMAEDRARATALTESEKDLREHAVVVDALRATLAPFVESVEPVARPAARAFPEGFHLHTRVRGKRAGSASILEILDAVHPTPAVCGEPRASAKAMLERAEPNRGWYSGGVGWVDARGDGRFAVALRTGLFAHGRLTAWAGAGVVAGSDPERERAEIDLKMQALLGAVGKRIV